MSDPTPTTVMADPTDPQRGPAMIDPAATDPAATDLATTRAPSR